MFGERYGVHFVWTKGLSMGPCRGQGEGTQDVRSFLPSGTGNLWGTEKFQDQISEATQGMAEVNVEEDEEEDDEEKKEKAGSWQ